MCVFCNPYSVRSRVDSDFCMMHCVSFVLFVCLVCVEFGFVFLGFDSKSIHFMYPSAVAEIH